jgi:hypothetical protein
MRCRESNGPAKGGAPETADLPAVRRKVGARAQELRVSRQR